VTFQKEFEIMATLRHPNVLGIVGGYLADDEADVPYTIITPWMARGSLDQVLFKPGALSATDKMRLVVGIVMGMRYLHACGLMHRDLKPGNVLVSRRLEARIGDLGSARRMDLQKTLTQNQGTVVYMAPELESDSYGPPVDVYAFGLMLWEFVKRERVFANFKSAFALHKAVCQGTRPDLKGFDPELTKLIEQCWQTAPSSRPTFPDIFRTLQEMEWQLFPDVDSVEIEKYVNRVEALEREHPPQDLEW
jgi:serine/threonine protein kinase